MPKSANRLAGARILIVEDEVLIAEELRERLQRLGSTITGHARTAPEAVALAERDLPDLVLMDIRLKGPVSGIEAAASIQERTHIPVVFLTAHADVETVLRARSADPFGYLLKPFSEVELINTVAAALDRHGLEDELWLSEERYAATLAGIGEGVVAADGFGKVVYLNNRAEELTGWTAGKALGARISDVVQLDGSAEEHPARQSLREQRVIPPAGVAVLQTASGGTALVEITAAPIAPAADRKQHTRGVVVTIRDVGSRVAAEQKMLEQARQLEGFFQSSLDLLAITDTSGLILRLNPEWERVLGFASEEMVGRPYLQFVHPEDRAHTLRHVESGRAGEILLNRVVGKDGNYRLLEWRIIVDESLVYAAARDITERRHTEEELERSEVRYRAVVDDQTEFIVRWQPRDGRITFLNEAFSRYFGAPGEGAGGSLFAFLEPDEESHRLRSQLQSLRTGDPIVMQSSRGRRIDGSWRWQEWVHRGLFSPDGTLNEIQSVGRDVHDRVAAEAQLREKSNLLRTLTEETPAAVAMFDREMRYLACSRRWLEDYGLTRRNINGLSHYEVFPEIGEEWKAIHQRCLAGATESREDDSFLRLDGHVDYLRWVVQPWYTAAGDVGGVIMFTEVTTARKQAEQALRRSEAMFASMFHGSPMAKAISDVSNQDRLVDVNNAFERVSGYSREEVAGRRVIELSLWCDPETYAVAKRTFRAQGKLHEFEFRFRRKDGEIRTGLISVEPILLDGLQYVVSTIVDITEQKLAEAALRRSEVEREKLEAQILQAQKMESIGRLAGGVAHDFNNLLTVINGYCDLILSRGRPGDPEHALLTEMRKAGGRGADLTRGLLAFSRRQMVRPQPVDLNVLILDSLDILRRLATEAVEIHTELDPEPALTMGDPGQLYQVLMNLVVNARDAMPAGGRVLIRTKHEKLPSPADASPDSQPYRVIEISDTGTGIDDSIREKIFEPFFTSKSNGTGLGLSVVYGIVQQAGGWISVTSRIGEGSTFRIGLPGCEAAGKDSAAAPLEVIVAGPQGNETILLVEDQDAVRKLSAMILAGKGYRVLESRNGEEALGQVAKHPGPIHLLLTDVIMPRLSGRELADQLQAIRPDLSVLFMSGYLGQDVLDPQADFLQKPFSPDDLVAKVRQVLGRAAVARPQKPTESILVVDDEESVRRYFATVLSEAGYQVVLASNGREADEVLQTSTFDLMLIDLVMPEREGIESITSIRPRYPAMKIVAVSGAFRGRFLVLAEKLGADATLEKPVSPEGLLETVRKLLLVTG